MATLLNTQEWACINLNCKHQNTLGLCPNCNSDKYAMNHLAQLQCKNCSKYWTGLVCPECNSVTRINDLNFPLPRCFIVTATYGTSQAQEVILLSQYRDTYLRKNMFGRTIINIYEYVSLPIANWIAKRLPARNFVRQVIIPPFLWIARRKIK